jgi:uncharacterized protein YrrD
MPDPVSWLMIEQGWKVKSADGKECGKVEQVVGDTGNDIFNGLSISTGLFSKPRYVPAERVSEIYEDEVHIDVAEDHLGRLDEYEQPAPSEEIVPPDRRS